MVTGRALHFVFKIPDRGLTAKFYREILGMKVIFLAIKFIRFILLSNFFFEGAEARGIRRWM